MTQYRKGVSFEYLVRDYLRAQGYICFRSAGSHGCADIIAWSKDEILFCQCKKEGKRRDNYVREKEEMAKVPVPSCGKRLFWVRRGNMVFVYPIGAPGHVREFDIKVMLRVVGT